MPKETEYDKIIIDLGTGDGRFVYKSALANPHNLYIGIDPSEQQLKIYARKVNRKKLANARFVVGSVGHLENLQLPPADELTINFPWGSLLQHVVKPEKDVVEEIAGLLKPGGKLTIVLGYSEKFDPSETARLDIPEIDGTLIATEIGPKFESYGNFLLVDTDILEKGDLRTIESTWGKRLGFGRDRPIYKIAFEKK